MLRNISPLLSPELLYALRAMGHGDEIAIVDANFPAESSAERCIRLDGVSATDLLEAVVKLLPLDTFVDAPASSMAVVGDSTTTPEIVVEFQRILDEHSDIKTTIAPLERFEFYDRARAAFAVVQTGEGRLYGNILLTKGVISL